jgi:hypothetical protein
MKIGLVRHFKVRHPFPKKVLLSAAEVVQWFDEYDLAEIEQKNVDLCGVEWKKCFCSPQERAAKTAFSIFKGEIIKSIELKELESLPFLRKNIRLPFLIWGMIIRSKFSSTNEATAEFKSKINTFLDELLFKNSTDVLIVSHFFVMLLLQKELIKKGFKGNTFKSPDYGKVYMFEK